MSQFEIVIDAQTPSRLAKFWSAAMNGYAIRAYDETEIARLAALGLTPDTDPSVAIDGPGPTIWFQQSDTPCTTRNRLHFDLKFGPRVSEQARLEKLGATIKSHRETHTVMRDPEGNQFCLFDP